MSQGSRESVEVGSNAVYDHTCQICAERGEKEAVRFCMSCDMYMCQTCCDQHKKIPLAINHRIIGKEKFGDIHIVKGLFEKTLIPTLTTQYPAVCQKFLPAENDIVQVNSNCELFHVLNDPNSESMLYFLFQESINNEIVLEIGTVDHNSGYITIFSRFVRDIDRQVLFSKMSCHNCNNMIYMIIPKTNKVTKFCCSHKGAYMAFELQAGNQCFAITPFNDGLAIVVKLDVGFYLPNWKIEIVKQDGKPITEFYFDDNGQPLFDTPRSITSNNSQDILFVSNQSCYETKSSVIALDRKGTVIFKYAIPGSHHIQRGLTYDTEGNFYLACDWKIIQIDKHGKKSRDLLKANTRNCPQIVSFNTKSMQLVVVDSSRKITHFKFV